MKNKKAVLGLDVAKLFVLAILVLVIISVVSLIVIDSISDTDPTDGVSLTNITTSRIVNETGTYPTGLNADSTDCTLTILIATTESGGATISSGNYTVAGCLINGSTATHPYNDTLWNITGTHTIPSQEKQITYNTSDSMSNFFADAGTWFTLIGVVIIILIISVVIRVVNGFGSGGNSTSAFG